MEKRLMEYKIISGRTVESRRGMMEPGGRRKKVRRNTRVKGKTSLKKILANEREAVKNLARILNSNFREGDMWLTLGYPDERLPEDTEAAKREISRFLRRCREELKKEGVKLRYVVATSETSTATGERARIHHHVVMDPMGYEAVSRLWFAGFVSYRRLDGRGDYTGIARYMVTNAGEAHGKKRWSTSKGLEKPIYTEPVPVRMSERVNIPRDASLKEKNLFQDEETGMMSLYVRFTKGRVMRN